MEGKEKRNIIIKRPKRRKGSEEEKDDANQKE